MSLPKLYRCGCGCIGIGEPPPVVEDYERKERVRLQCTIVWDCTDPDPGWTIPFCRDITATDIAPVPEDRVQDYVDQLSKTYQDARKYLDLHRVVKSLL